jgi:hypothetical protein
VGKYEKNAGKNKKRCLLFMAVPGIIPNVAVAEEAAGQKGNQKNQKVEKTS